MAEGPIFQRLALIGLGLIGSSVARAVRLHGLAGEIVGHARSEATRDRAMALGFLDRVEADPAEAVRGADIVMICSPLGTYRSVASAMAPGLMEGALVTDVGSVKACALRDLAQVLPDTVEIIPGHPIAGTEHSGPDAGFAELFRGRYCILTPPDDADPAALGKLAQLWRKMGSTVEIMTAEHHDRVLAVTSHLPHLIAYTIVGTATDLEEDLKAEVIRFSASGFRDFTRIAASDPVMWRDVFLNNKEAVLEVIQRFNEDLTALQRAIRWGEGDKLEELFTRTRAIRRGVIDAKQA
ncbi:MAG TPA: prephenate/arogenate dehydrogenase family protein [Alphaproteobacteria bacterium]|nr:prephenate/arogenate dehydrogenase family protein [Alphaproteobacteria bacterium]